MISGALVFAALPLLVWLGQARAPASGWREAAVRATLAWATAVLVLTEGLSVCHALRFGPVLSAWIVIDGMLAISVWREWRYGSRPSAPQLDTWWLRSAAAVLAGLLVISLATAILAPPNTPDALSYHLPRQLMWLQQGGVQHFVTLNDRALMMPPLYEMMQAQTLLLSGGDGWANFPSWLAYGLGLVVASLLARELGAGRAAQALAAVVFATVPMAWHSASGAKNDLLVADWLGILAWLALRLSAAPAGSRRQGEWLAAGVACGLALATKTTALIFVAPPLALLAAAAWRNPRGATLLAGTALLLPAPHAWRNIAWYGTPLGVHRAEDGGAQALELYSWRSVASNAVRNATLHLATPSAAINQKIYSAVSQMHDWLGLGVNDRRTTLWVLHYGVAWGPRDEMVAGAPMQFLLGLAAVPLLLRRAKLRGANARAIALLASGALLYCVALKWQPAGARLQLPVFLLLAAIVARAAECLGPRGLAATAAVCVLGWLPSAETSDRPHWTAPRLWEWTRWENYFRFDPAEGLRQEACLRALQNARVGSLQIVTRHGFPYPLMRRFLAEGGPKARLWGALPAALMEPPDAVLVLEDQPHPATLRPPGASRDFVRVAVPAPYALYVSAAGAR